LFFGCHPWRDFIGFDKPQPGHPCPGAQPEKDTLSVFLNFTGFCFSAAIPGATLLASINPSPDILVRALSRKKTR